MTSPASRDSTGRSARGRKHTHRSKEPAPPSIADPFNDLLTVLDESRRRGLIRRLAIGYYEGWRPTRAEIAKLIAVETGQITDDQYFSLPTESCLHYLNKLQPQADTAVTVESGLPPQRNEKIPTLPHYFDPFRIDCGRVVGPYHFIALGLTPSGWLQRGGRHYRLVHLRYKLVSEQSVIGAQVPAHYAAPITCVDASNFDLKQMTPSNTHVVVDDQVLGSRGPWPLPPTAQHVRFRIFSQVDGHSHYRLAGCLHVNGPHGTRWQPWQPSLTRPPDQQELPEGTYRFTNTDSAQ